jgi:hypothetical protein
MIAVDCSGRPGSRHFLRYGSETVKTSFVPAAILGVFLAAVNLTRDALGEEKQEAGFESFFDGQTLKGWHAGAQTGHSRASGNKSGGRWGVENGAIVGSRDIPGDGGILLTDEQWKAGQWNELRARSVGNPPHITTWIKDVKFMDWTETEKRHPDKGSIALQVHGGGDFTNQFVRYGNIRLKRLDQSK